MGGTEPLSMPAGREGGGWVCAFEEEEEVLVRFLEGLLRGLETRSRGGVVAFVERPVMVVGARSEAGGVGRGGGMGACESGLQRPEPESRRRWCRAWGSVMAAPGEPVRIVGEAVR